MVYTDLSMNSDTSTSLPQVSMFACGDSEYEYDFSRCDEILF